VVLAMSSKQGGTDLDVNFFLRKNTFSFVGLVKDVHESESVQKYGVTFVVLIGFSVLSLGWRLNKRLYISAFSNGDWQMVKKDLHDTEMHQLRQSLIHQMLDYIVIIDEL